MSAPSVRTLIATAPRIQTPIAALVTIGLAIFFLAALAYYHVALAGRGEYQQMFQLMVVGCYDFLGFVPAFMMWLWVLAWASIWFLTGELERPWMRGGRILLLTVCLAVLVNLPPGADAASYKGELGLFLASGLVSTLGGGSVAYVISVLLIAPITFAALLLATDFFFYRYFEGIVRGSHGGLAAETGAVRGSSREVEGVEDDATEAFKQLAAFQPSGQPSGTTADRDTAVEADWQPEPAAEPVPVLSRRERRLLGVSDIEEELPVATDTDPAAELPATGGAAAADGGELTGEPAPAAAAEGPIGIPGEVEGHALDEDDVAEDVEGDGEDDGEDDVEFAYEEVDEDDEFDEDEDDAVDDASDDEVHLTYGEGADDDEEEDEDYEEVDELADEEDDEDEVGLEYDDDDDDEDWEEDEDDESAAAEPAADPGILPFGSAQVGAVAGAAAADGSGAPVIKDDVIKDDVIGDEATADDSTDDERREDERDARQAYPEDEPVTVLPAVPPTSTPVPEPAARPASTGVDLELLAEAESLVRSSRRASASFLQRRLKVDYEEAVDLLVALETQGVVALDTDGSQGRVL